MRGLIALLLLAAAIWRAVLDWRATIGQGHAYRTTPIGQVLADAAPGFYERLVAGWQASPLLWDPVGATVMALPLAPLLALVALIVWITRPRRR